MAEYKIEYSRESRYSCRSRIFIVVAGKSLPEATANKSGMYSNNAEVPESSTEASGERKHNKIEQFLKT